MHARLMLTILSVYLSVLFLPATVSAANPANVSVNIAPANPAPGETVTISLTSYAYALDSTPITWSVDGQTSISGVGEKTLSVIAPAAGKELRVVVALTFPDGNIQKSIVVRPAVMALLWQANDSYVPPFYKGKALPSLGSEIKLVALPEIKSGAQAVSPKSLVYAWKKDYANEPAASGYGKNFYTYTHDYLDKANMISVTASTTDQKYSSSRSLTLGTFDPKIVFYPQDTNIGTRWERSLGSNYHISGEEVIEAAPYFVSPGDIRVPSFTWDWFINDTYVNVTDPNNVLPVRVDTGASGTSRIKLELSNKYKLFASAAKELVVEF